MKISVIIPIYNSENSLKRCFDSVRNQTFPAHYELLAVNDGSTDHSLEIIEQYIFEHPDLDIKLIDQPNQGVSAARNAGLQAATGEYIALLDSDDEWLPEKTAKQIAVLEANPNIDFLGCNVTSWQASILGVRKKALSRIKLWQQFISWYPSTPTVIFKRECLEDVGLYDHSMSHGEDGHFLIRMLMKKECWFMPDQLVAIGGGKPAFGYSGLSSNLSAMYKGQREILRFAYRSHAVNTVHYIFFRLYAAVKHWRRVLITKLR